MVIRQLPEGPTKDEYIKYGEFVLNTSVISIIISAPLGAVITNTMGPVWLSKDVNSVTAETKVDSKTGGLTKSDLKVQPVSSDVIEKMQRDSPQKKDSTTGISDEGEMKKTGDKVSL